MKSPAIPVLIAVILLGALGAAGDEPTTTPTTKHSNDAKKIATLEAYYAKLYAQPLTMKPRLPKLIGLMSLAKLDADATTAALIEAVGNKDPMVAYLAWEILHARRESLAGAKYDYWVQRGIELAASGEMPGNTIAPMLDAGASIPHAQVSKLSTKLFDLILTKYSPTREGDVVVLKSAGQLLAAWNDPTLLSRVAKMLNDSTSGPTAEYLLMSLAGAPSKDEPAEKRKALLQKLASSAASAGPATRPYTGVGKLVAKPARITNPADEQWHKELELNKLTISNFDLAWVMDSTGSMNQPNQTVAAETARVMKIISMFSDQARVGAVYFRHETDPKLYAKCCGVPMTEPAYQTKPLELNKDASALAKAMAEERIPKPEPKLHNTHPGSAVHGGLSTAVTKLAWNKDPGAKRVIVLIGDSPLTPGSEQTAKDLAAATAKDGFAVHAITLTPQSLKEWHPVIEAAGGIHFHYAPRAGAGGPGAKAAERAGVERVSDFGVIARLMIKASIGKQYQDRVDPLFGALEPFIEQSVKSEAKAK